MQWGDIAGEKEDKKSHAMWIARKERGRCMRRDDVASRDERDEHDERDKHDDMMSMIDKTINLSLIHI